MISMIWSNFKAWNGN